MQTGANIQIKGSARDESLSAPGLLQGLPHLFCGCPPSPQPRGDEVSLAKWERSSAGAAGGSTPALQRARGPCPGIAGETLSSPGSCVWFALQTLWGYVALKSRQQRWGPRDGDRWFGPRSMAQGAGEP